jgi:uncharacterized YigZ family protein
LLKSSDTFKTLASASEEILFKEKNSKFYGYAFPVTSEVDVKPIIDTLRKKHFNAVHFCYAYQLGTTNKTYRANDDGEPSNSAGMPIYGQIQSSELTNVLVVIVRFFGGVKLGVGGLINAYKTAAKMAIENAAIIEKTIDVHFLITFDYKNMNKVMRIIKEKNLNIVAQSMETHCEIEITTRQSNADFIDAIFENLFEVQIRRRA